MTKKEFDITGYKLLMANLLGDPDGKNKVFFEALDFAVEAHSGQWRKRCSAGQKFWGQSPGPAAAGCNSPADGPGPVGAV